MTGTNVTRGYGLLENYLNRRRCAVANRLIPSPLREGRILDIGCGTFPSFLYSTSFAEKYGLDQVVSMSDMLVKEKIHIQQLDLENTSKLPFEDDFFDVATMLAVIEHLRYETTSRVLTEVFRILKPGGICILTTPAKWTDRILRTMARFYLVSPREMEEHKCLYDRYKILDILRLSHFREDNIHIGFFEMHMNIWGRATKDI